MRRTTSEVVYSKICRTCVPARTAGSNRKPGTVETAASAKAALAYRRTWTDPGSGIPEASTMTLSVAE
jgi:hypothetical protein